MSVLQRVLVLLLAVLPMAPAVAAPLEAYGGLPSIESINISPDGTKLAVTASTGEDRILLIKTISDGSVQSYPVGAIKVRALDWLGSDRVIITTSQTTQITDLTGPRQEYFLGFQLNLVTRKAQPLLNRTISTGQTGTHIIDDDAKKVSDALNILVGPPEVRQIDGKQVLFLRGITFPDRRGVLTVFRVDPKTGNTDIAELGDERTQDIVLDQEGQAVARADYDDTSGQWTLKLRQSGGWKASRTLEAKTEQPFLAGLGRDGRSVVVGQMGETGLVLREVSETEWGPPLDVGDARSMIFDPVSHRLIGLYALVGEEARYTFFDPADQKAWNSVRAAFKADHVRLESWSDDRSKIVVFVDSATLGPAFALVDMTTKRATWLGGKYQKLKPEDVASARPIKLKAKDGLDLSGYLTTPSGMEAKNLPLIVFPHGGPASRDTPGFDWWAQGMASRGYAVLQVNFRGSDGYGWSFLNAGFGEWGRKMQTDLSDSVRQLAADGTIDPKRVCIVGASYGGYAAMAGAALDTGVYRCAVAVSGLSDLRRFVEWSKDKRSRAAFRYWTRFMGAQDSRDPKLAEISPAAHVDKVTIPLLLIHGKDDTVVPLEQSQIMADAMRKAGKPVELLIQKGEDHWLSRGETRLQTLTATMAFVEKHNPPN